MTAPLAAEAPAAAAMVEGGGGASRQADTRARGPAGDRADRAVDQRGGARRGAAELAAMVGEVLRRSPQPRLAPPASGLPPGRLGPPAVPRGGASPSWRPRTPTPRRAGHSPDRIGVSGGRIAGARNPNLFVFCPFIEKIIFCDM